MLRVVGSVAASVLICVAVIVGISSYHSTPSAAESSRSSPTQLAALAEPTELIACDPSQSGNACAKAIGDALEQKWANDKKSGQAAKDLSSMSNGFDLLTKTVSTLKHKGEPNKAEVAGIVASVGTLAGGMVPPPVGTVIAGVAAVFSGFITEKGPSNQQVLDAVTGGFKELGSKVDQVMGAVLDNGRKLTQIQADVTNILNRVERIAIHQLEESIDETAGRYDEYMTRWRAAIRNGTPSGVDLVKSYLEASVNRLAHESRTHGAFSGEKVEELLGLYLAHTNRYVAAIKYHLILAARVKLFGMKADESNFKTNGMSEGNTAFVREYAEKLKADVEQYSAVIQRLGLECLVRLSDEELVDLSKNDPSDCRPIICNRGLPFHALGSTNLALLVHPPQMFQNHAMSLSDPVGYAQSWVAPVRYGQPPFTLCSKILRGDPIANDDSCALPESGPGPRSWRAAGMCEVRGGAEVLNGEMSKWRDCKNDKCVLDTAAVRSRGKSRGGSMPDVPLGELSQGGVCQGFCGFPPNVPFKQSWPGAEGLDVPKAVESVRFLLEMGKQGGWGHAGGWAGAHGGGWAGWQG